MLHDIWQAETREDARAAFDLFIGTFEAKYPKATECLIRDRDELLTFYDFPARHWQSIRTSNPIESAFATIRHRTKRTKGCLSRDGMLHTPLVTFSPKMHCRSTDVQARAMRRKKLAQAARLHLPR